MKKIASWIQIATIGLICLLAVFSLNDDISNPHQFPASALANQLYTRITYPKVQFFTNTGQFAVGYKVYTIKAGTVDTLQTTYQNRTLTTPNTNPIVLDSRGEANIYTNQAVKLVFTIPTGTISSPLITVDYVGEQQETVIVNGDAIPGTTENNYVMTVTPVFTSITTNLMVVMKPDVDNQNTLGSTIFTGTGINDLTFSGPYIGSTAGSVFTVEARGAGTPIATTIAENAAAGSVTAGNHYVKLTAVTATGESLPGAVSNLVTAAGSKKIDVSGIPAIAGLITGYKVYMTKAGGSDYYYVATVTSTTYTINVADASLTVLAPTTQTATDWVRWKKDGGAWTDQVLITAAKQITIEGVAFKFAEIIGHTIGDIWTVAVTTPARLNFCALGNNLIYKNVAGSLVALDGGDLKQDIPATFVWSAGVSGWILNNPSLPTLTTIIPNRIRKEVTGTYSMVSGDQGTEISCSGTFSVNLLAPPSAPHTFWYVRNSGTGVITVDAGTGYIIRGPGGHSDQTYILYPGDAIQLETNGVNYDILTSIYSKTLTYEALTAASGTWTRPSWIRIINYIIVGGGAGGGGSTGIDSAGGGGGGGATLIGQLDVSAISSIAYTIAQDVNGGSASGTDGTDGQDTVFDTYATAKGGKKGTGSGDGTAKPGGLGGNTDLSDIQTSLICLSGDPGISGSSGGKSGGSRGAGGAVASNGSLYGGGGGGGNSGGGGGGVAGGKGKAGAIIIWY